MSLPLSLVIPLYNEEENARPVISELVPVLREAALPFELILVDNGSRDRTGPLLAELAGQFPEIRVVTVPVNQGYGWGVLQGLGAARGAVLGFMGGDGQTEPQDVVRVYRALERGDVALAKACRIRRQDGLQRRLITRIANLLFRLVFGLRTRDVNGTPKLLRRELYERLNPRSKDWFLDAELMIGCARAGLPYREVPATFRPRARGASNVRAATLLEFLKNMFRAWKEPHR